MKETHFLIHNFNHYFSWTHDTDRIVKIAVLAIGMTLVEWNAA